MRSRLIALSLVLLMSAPVFASNTLETLPSGVTVEMLNPVARVKPTAQDTVKVHYRGTLAAGTQFDSSYKRNQPATFPLNEAGEFEEVRLG